MEQTKTNSAKLNLYSKPGIFFKTEYKSKDEKEIAGLLEKYYKALKEDNVKEVGETLSKVALMHSYNPAFTKPDNKQRYLKTLETERKIEPVSFEDVEIKIGTPTPDLAAAKALVRFKEGGVIIGPRTVIFGFKKEAGGWKIIVRESLP